MAAKFEEKSATKDTVHNVLVALYLFPKFHECTNNISQVIALLTFRTDGRTEGRTEGRNPVAVAVE